MINNVLRSIPKPDRDALKPHLRRVELPRGKVLAWPGDNIENVYFLHCGIASFFVELDDGSEVQTLMVGSDGVIGAAQAFDSKTSLNKIIVQVDAIASVVDRGIVRQLTAERSLMRNTLASHEQFIVADIQQTAACNARHNIEQRCCRWLMRMRDLCGPVIPVTQNALAGMIGVRRTSVTELAHKLKGAGILSYTRGSIKIMDEKRLEKHSCGCNRQVRHHYETIFCCKWPRAEDVTRSA